MLIPLLGILIPSLITTAEHLIGGEGKGEQKKSFVMDMLGKLYDFFQQKGDIPAFFTKDCFTSLCSFLIDHYVPVLTN